MMSTGNSRATPGWSRRPEQEPSPKFFRLSQLRRLRACEQVAAVCFRLRERSVEFLLVQTRGGRWTFPKGSAEPGLTHAQAAALEAFEEAGVHGRIEEASFTRYLRRKGDTRNSASIKLAVNAYLCEVLRLDPPQESDRNRTWFSAQEAKRRLREDRAPDYAAELARVVNCAVSRIQRLRLAATAPTVLLNKGGPGKDALQKVLFIDADRGKIVGDKISGPSRKLRGSF